MTFNHGLSNRMLARPNSITVILIKERNCTGVSDDFKRINTSINNTYEGLFNNSEYFQRYQQELYNTMTNEIEIDYSVNSKLINVNIKDNVNWEKVSKKPINTDGLFKHKYDIIE